MSLSTQIAKHFRDVHFGGNWTTSNLKDNLSGVTWQQAMTQVHDFNTIARLVYHINFYVVAALSVLRGQGLHASDKYAFDCPPLSSEADWQAMLSKTWAEAEDLAALIEDLPEDRWMEIFVDERYGNYYRNIHGIIEHTHYHLGQIALIKKIVQHGSLPT
jgi:hypothetical protein